MDMAVTKKKDGPMCCPEPISADDSSKPSYPEVCFRDEHCDKLQELLGGELPDVDEHIIATVKLKCVGRENNRWGKKAEFAIVGADESTSGFAPEDDEDEGEEAEPEGKQAKSKGK